MDGPETTYLLKDVGLTIELTYGLNLGKEVVQALHNNKETTMGFFQKLRESRQVAKTTADHRKIASEKFRLALEQLQAEGELPQYHKDNGSPLDASIWHLRTDTRYDEHTGVGTDFWTVILSLRHTMHDPDEQFTINSYLALKIKMTRPTYLEVLRGFSTDIDKAVKLLQDNKHNWQSNAILDYM